MLKKAIVAALVLMIFNLVNAPIASARDNTEKEAGFAAKVKSEISRLGTGTDARVKIKLKNGTKLEGYVSQINEVDFTVIEKKTGIATNVPYRGVKQIKGNNLSDGAVIAIAFGALFGVLIITYLVKTSKKSTF
ncbi:MAG: hypothetical protein ACRD6X_18240 [Pyrinomonadaceae bacterium]